MLLREGLMRRLGGVTGDAAGAICELLEAAALVMAVLLL
jgi:cobalamin synthase